jgi:hypothetical protein
MKIKDEYEKWADILEKQKLEKYIKFGVITITIVAGIYLLGYEFVDSALFIYKDNVILIAS